MTVIDLDAGRPAEAEPSSRPPVRTLRPIGLVLAAVLLFALGGAAPAAATLFRGLGQIPLAPDDLYALSGGYLLTVESPQEHPRLSAWDTEPLRRRWTTELDPGVPPLLINTNGVRLIIVGDRLLAQSEDYRTTAVDLRTGQKLWESPVPVNPAAPGIGLARAETYPPGSEAEADGSGGAMYISPTGVQYTKPPLTTDISGIDLATGRALWTHHHTGSTSTSRVEDGPGLLSVTGPTIRLLNPQTGQVLAERTLATVNGFDLVGDLVLVGEGEQMGAYDTRTLEPRWRAPEDRSEDYLSAGLCRALICRRGPAGAEVLNPATGTAAWTAGPELNLRREGPVVLVTDGSSGRPLRLLDPATGTVVAPLDNWQMATPFGEILLTRVEPGGRKLSFGVVKGTKVQPLGNATLTASECRTDAGLAACRTLAGLSLFKYPLAQP